MSDAILICNDELQLIRVRPDLFDEVVEFYQEHFLKNEPVYTAMDFLSSDLARHEAGLALRECLKDEVSFAARHCGTKEVVAIRLNRMQATLNMNSGFQFQSPALICKSEYIRRVKNSFDLINEWNIDCVMELSGLSTRPDFCARGLGTILTKHTLEFTSKLRNGTLAESSTLPAHIRDLKPQAVCVVCSSLFSQKLSEKLGLKTLGKIPFSEFIYEGKPVSEKMDPIHQFATYAAMRL